MKDDSSALHQCIAEHVRALRAARGWSIEALAQRSGVSRSMISLIERGESNASAVVLERLATALGVMLASLFDAPGRAAAAPPAPLARRDEQPCWRDPGSGYQRRNVTPAGTAQPMRIVDVAFPAGARVAFETAGREGTVCQQVWLLKGEIRITLGAAQHRLTEGDCLAMQLDQPIVFHNPTRRAARYAVVIASTGEQRSAPNSS